MDTSTFGVGGCRRRHKIPVLGNLRFRPYFCSAFRQIEFVNALVLL